MTDEEWILSYVSRHGGRTKTKTCLEVFGYSQQINKSLVNRPGAIKKLFVRALYSIIEGRKQFTPESFGEYLETMDYICEDCNYTTLCVSQQTEPHSEKCKELRG